MWPRSSAACAVDSSKRCSGLTPRHGARTSDRILGDSCKFAESGCREQYAPGARAQLFQFSQFRRRSGQGPLRSETGLTALPLHRPDGSNDAPVKGVRASALLQLRIRAQVGAVIPTSGNHSMVSTGAQNANCRNDVENGNPLQKRDKSSAPGGC